jgi:iron(III) transport system substrate-binding protein
MPGMHAGRTGRGVAALAACAAIVLALTHPARAQPSPSPAPSPAGPVAAIALYDGADRAERLREGARREGSLTIYSSMPAEDMQAQIVAFERRTGITVRVWRASGLNVLQRAVAEARAGRSEADILECAGTNIEALQRERVLQEVRSPALAGIDPRAIPPHRGYVGTRVLAYTLAYNTNAVRADELPRRWEDLADSRWRGRLGMAADAIDWFATVVSGLGTERGLELFRTIAATNGIALRQGHSLLSNLVASGEVPLALSVYDYRIGQLRQAGAPVGTVRLAPTPALLAGIGLAAAAPRPHAAILFFDFMLTEGQEILAAQGFTPTRGAAAALDDPPITLIDAPALLDDNRLWNERFRSVMARQAR